MYLGTYQPAGGCGTCRKSSSNRAQVFLVEDRSTEVFVSLQDVTTGARNKILISIKKLNERSETLAKLEKVSWENLVGN